ncbi:helix-turn-helix domain-containing protein [Streptomyces sp. NPDC045470]|uniref:helix-turn-helix domain-containing protein n=1 Tax=Streptomyces sp. NPDC045470 TaxID=3155469 RepID=UPI0033E3AECC
MIRSYGPSALDGADRYTDPIGRLAQELRRARLRRGLSRLRLAEKAGSSVATVQRAEAGRVRPTWPVTRRLAAVCGVDIDLAERLWRNAGRPGRPRLTEAPRVNLIRTPADLAAALRRAWEGNGAPSLRCMEARAETLARQYAPLSRMAAWRIRERKQTTSSLGQLYAYLAACGVPQSEFPAWAQAWHRAGRHEEPALKRRSPPAPLGAPGENTPRRAAALMLEAGLATADPFPGMHVPWAARCRPCGKLSRYTFARVLEGASCPVCLHFHAVAASEQGPPDDR